VDASYFSGSIKRGYLNGAALDKSKGDTSGSGFGALARVGYSLPAGERVRLTPFASLNVAYSTLDGYTETTGSLPASFASMNDTAVTGRAGSDLRYTLADNKWLFGTFAWAHRFDDARTSDVSAVVLGVLPVTTAGGQLAKDWGEVTVGLHTPLGRDGLVLDASVTGVLPAGGYAKTYQIRLGFTQSF
jgi:outer membrane autotransporter protein